MEDEARRKEISMYILTSFYVIGYQGDEDFYQQVQQRMNQGTGRVGMGTL